MKEQKRFLDVGGGTYPDFFLAKAREDGNSQYIVFDPTIKPVVGMPDNLHLVRGQIDDSCELPFADRSIDGIFLNNIYGEVRTDGKNLDWADTDIVFKEMYLDSRDVEDARRQKDLYYKIISGCKKVLKAGGTITIIEPSDNSPRAISACTGQGFRVHRSPRPVSSANKSLWTKWFLSPEEMLAADNRLEDVVPTEFVVQLAV